MRCGLDRGRWSSTRVTGGFAGLNQTLTVFASGEMTLVDGKGVVTHGMASAADIDRINQFIASREFAGAASATTGTGADRFTHVIETRTWFGSRTLRAMDGLPQPGSVSGLTAELGDLIGKCM